MQCRTTQRIGPYSGSAPDMRCAGTIPADGTAWRQATDQDRRLRARVQRVLAGLAGLGVTFAGG